MLSSKDELHQIIVTVAKNNEIKLLIFANKARSDYPFQTG
jgi:hypothetical protein